MLALDHYVDRFKQPFLHPITPVKNLYMTGSDIMTAGVGGAMMAGMMTTCAMQGRKAGDVVKLLKSYQEKDKTQETNKVGEKEKTEEAIAS
jgi:all-trans-retinol 13,14-reductase